MLDYKRRLVEVDEILNHLSREDLLKIPEDVRDIIKNNKDKNYVWEYDEKKHLRDQDLNDDTIAILSYLNTEYILNEEQKNLMKQIYAFNEKKTMKEMRKLNEKKISDRKLEKYDVAKSQLIKDEIKEMKEADKQGITKYKGNFFVKMINKIKKLLKK